MIAGRVQKRVTRRTVVNAIGTVVAVVAVVVALIPLGAMLGYVLLQGASSINLAFFTQLPVGMGQSGGGMLNAITGTLVLIAIASLIGLPVGILSGIYLARSGRTGFPQAVRFVADVIAGLPSIVAGVVAYALVVVPTHSFSAFSGGVALALLMFPTVTRATEEAVRLVPISVREAGLAVGLPEWKTTVRIILPTAAGGIVTAVMLGIARVAGETAPLLFTAFGSPSVTFSPGQPVEALPLQIWYYATSPYEDWHRQAWAGALVLFVLIVVLNLTARVLTRRLASRASNL